MSAASTSKIIDLFDALKRSLETRPAETHEQRPVALPLSTARLPSEVLWTRDGSTLTCDWLGERIEVQCTVCSGEAYALGDIAHSIDHPLTESLWAAVERHADELLAAVRADSAEAGWP